MRGFLRSTVTLAIGYAIAAALFWALLSVPESNALTLTLSAALVLLLAVTVGITTGLASAAPNIPIGTAARRASAALPAFVAGLAVFALLWWLTGSADGWWRAHRGEVDALFLRYAGATRTAPIHRAVFWITWLMRWVLAPSVILGLVTAAVLGRRAGEGLRLAVHIEPLGATTIGVLVASQGLWRLAIWNPRNLPANWTQPALVAMKLFVLYAAAAAIAGAVLGVYRRAAEGTTVR